MNHIDLVNYVLHLDGAVFTVAVLAFYYFGERFGHFERSIQGTDKALAGLRQKISGDLDEILAPVFERSHSVPSVLVDRWGETYSEKPANPVKGEVFREAFRKFLEKDNDALADYRIMYQARSCWICWTRTLSWSLVALLVTQAGGLALAGVVEKVLGYLVPDVAYRVCCCLPVVLGGWCLVTLPFILWNYDHIVRVRNRYGDL